MILGIYRRQWFLILTILSLSAFLNVAGMWQRFGPDKLIQTFIGTYEPLHSEVNYHNPWTAILGHALATITILGALAWFGILISAKVYLQQTSKMMQHIVVFAITLCVAVLFTFGTIHMSDVWDRESYFYFFRSGIPGDHFVRYWSWRLVFPLTVILMFYALQISQVSGSSRIKKPA